MMRRRRHHQRRRQRCRHRAVASAHVEEAAENLRARIQPRRNVQDGAGCMFGVARGAHLPIALSAVAESDGSANVITKQEG